MATQIRVKKQLLLDLIVTAFEGGSNYWLNESFGPGTVKRDSELNYTRAQFTALEDINDAVKTGTTVVITTGTVRTGLQRLHDAAKAQTFPSAAQHYRDAISEDGDAITADVVLQLGIFGELVFG